MKGIAIIIFCSLLPTYAYSFQGGFSVQGYNQGMSMEEIEKVARDTGKYVRVDKGTERYAITSLKDGPSAWDFSIRFCNGKLDYLTHAIDVGAHGHLLMLKSFEKATDYIANTLDTSASQHSEYADFRVVFVHKSDNHTVSLAMLTRQGYGYTNS